MSRPLRVTLSQTEEARTMHFHELNTMGQITRIIAGRLESGDTESSRTITAPSGDPGQLYGLLQVVPTPDGRKLIWLDPAKIFKDYDFSSDVSTPRFILLLLI